VAFFVYLVSSKNYVLAGSQLPKFYILSAVSAKKIHFQQHAKGKIIIDKFHQYF
jgi:hypothetical protein